MKNIFLIFTLFFFSNCFHGHGGERIVKKQLDEKKKIIIEYSTEEVIPDKIAKEITNLFILEFKKGFPEVEIIPYSSTLKPEEKSGLLTVVIFHRFDSYKREENAKIIKNYFIEAEAVFFGPQGKRSEVNYFEYSIGTVFLGDGAFFLSKNDGPATELVSGLLSALFDNNKPLQEDFEKLKKDVLTKTRELIEILQKTDDGEAKSKEPVLSEQQKEEQKPVIKSMQEIKEKFKTINEFTLFSGEIYRGGIVKNDKNHYVLMTENGEIKIPKSQIKTMKVAQ